MSLPLILALVALVAGLIAAGYWFASALINNRPFIIPNDWTAANTAWIETIRQDLQKSADRNRWAAIWTALSVVFSACASVFGTVACR